MLFCCPFYALGAACPLDVASRKARCGSVSYWLQQLLVQPLSAFKVGGWTQSLRAVLFVCRAAERQQQLQIQQQHLLHLALLVQLQQQLGSFLVGFSFRESCCVVFQVIPM